jgi:hypothetical protein
MQVKQVMQQVKHRHNLLIEADFADDERGGEEAKETRNVRARPVKRPVLVGLFTCRSRSLYVP